MWSNLESSDIYHAWRERKLEAYPHDLAALRVQVARLDRPSPSELMAIRERVAQCNMALVACSDPAQIRAPSLLQLGRHLGLARVDTHLCASADGVSRIRVEASGPSGEYIPYTNRSLNWHTDGYYNRPDRSVRAWMLFCVQDAVDGGENALLDPEIAYLRLRDRDPELIATLMDPHALEVPANNRDGITLREMSVGPVFSCLDGALHMRYTARARHARWRATATTDAARAALTSLFSSQDNYIYRHKLKPGEGFVTNNVLHNRSSFDTSVSPRAGRELLRVRYLDRIGA